MPGRFSRGGSIASAEPNGVPTMSHVSTLADQPQCCVEPPHAPGTLQESGLSLDLVMQLALKTLHAAGELTGTELARRLGLLVNVIEPALDLIRGQRHCEVIGGSILGAGSYRYRITTEGRSTAAVFLEQNRYVGVAPVPLQQYRDYVARVSAAAWSNVTRDTVQKAFGHMIVSDTVLDEIGPAVRSGRSIFIYGAPGNGKTAMAQAVRDLLAGDVAIPHAIDVDGSIVRLLDSVNHEERPTVAEAGLSVDFARDRRWAICRRPMVRAGGELSLESLELMYDARLGHYRAPLQLVANCGVLIVDDFGRQRCAPQELLNRWMVPLENGVDFLTLQSGLKFEVPFAAFVVFATNLKPSQLVDEAFLRRVPHKVFAENPSREQFIRIFARCCRDAKAQFEPGIAQYLLDGFYRTHNIEARACHPRDLINHAMRLADYRGDAHALTRELIDTACASYFVKDRE